jgi:hypothetical protein
VETYLHRRERGRVGTNTYDNETAFISAVYDKLNICAPRRYRRFCLMEVSWTRRL